MNGESKNNQIFNQSINYNDQSGWMKDNGIWIKCIAKKNKIEI